MDGMVSTCPRCQVPLPQASAARCPSCGAVLGSSGSLGGTGWESWVSALISLVLHAALMVLLGILTVGQTSESLPTYEVRLGELPAEQLTEQESEVMAELAEPTVEQQPMSELLVEVELPTTAIDAGGDSVAAITTPSASGSVAEVQFDVGLPGASGGGGDWEGLIQTLRRNGLDIVIVFDSTGSMAGEIDEVKRQIERIFQTLVRLVPKTRVSLCTYRDYGDDYVVKGVELTNDLQRLVVFLREVYADAGGDMPEAVHEGLAWAITKNSFRPPARKVILLFGDAPPHAEHLQTCLKLAGDFRRQHQGIVSTITCRSVGRLPEFDLIAKSGGGEAFTTADERQIITQLMVLVFGSRHREKVIEAFRLMERRR